MMRAKSDIGDQTTSLVGSASFPPQMPEHFVWGRRWYHLTKFPENLLERKICPDLFRFSFAIQTNVILLEGANNTVIITAKQVPVSEIHV